VSQVRTLGSAGTAIPTTVGLRGLSQVPGDVQFVDRYRSLKWVMLRLVGVGACATVPWTARSIAAEKQKRVLQERPSAQVLR